MSGCEKRIVVVFGRFNPPTKAHQKLFWAASNFAWRNSDYGRVYTTPGGTKTKNPLTTDQKLFFLNQFCPLTVKITESFFGMLKDLTEEGFSHVTIMCGSDREQEYKEKLHKYNGTEWFSFKMFQVITPLPFRIETSQETYSATKARQFATEGNFKEFQRMCPEESTIKLLYDEVRRGLGVV